MITEQMWDSIRWKSRRGMREIDLMLTPFVDKHLPKLGEDVFKSYNEFLNLTDLDLVRFLLRRVEPEDVAVKEMVDLIIKCHDEDLKNGDLPTLDLD